jgi:hypothetical protein
VDAPALELEIDAPTGRGDVTGQAGPLVVATVAAVTALRADGSFFRLCSAMMRAYRSPKTPPSAEAATKPGNEKRDRMDLGLFMPSTILHNLHRFQAR